MSADELRRRVRAFAEAHQRVGEVPVGVHRHVAGDVVEDVRLGQVVELVAVADGDGGGKLAVAQAVEEQERRNVAADRLGLEAGERAQEPVDVFEPRNAIRARGTATSMPGQEMLVRVALPARAMRA